MSESKPEYRAAVEADLGQMLTVSQMAALAARLREIIANGYGEVSIRIDGDRVYIVQSISHSAGRLPNC